MQNIFKSKQVSAYDAISAAQRIAFAPVIFQAVRALRDLGILSTLDSAGSSGTTVDSIAAELGLSKYGVQVLLESGLSSGVIDFVDEEHFVISKVGHFLLHDRMTRINMDFNHFVCYQGMYHLDESIVNGRPAGLRVMDENHSTLYEALPHLSEDIKSSWHAFDHHYSDAVYPIALEIILSRHPETLVDIGANQGRFSTLAAEADDSLRVTMIDLPDQLSEAVSLVDRSGFGHRVDSLSMDIRLEDSEMPRDRDAYWLSQLLCCFSETEIVSILQRLATAMTADSRVYILETCWDRQQHEAAAFSLVNTSLYFTCIANGNSKMYTSGELLSCIERSGLQCDRVTHNLSNFHTLLECRKTPVSA
jgi:hypothetical protein